jgi:hypothetical protein
MYKCVDARGVTQYSDKPCPGGKGKEVDIRGQPPISGKLQEQSNKPADAESDFRRRQLQRAREDHDQAIADEAQKRRCGQLRAERQRWTSVGRAFVIDGKGERRYIDAAEREAKTAQYDAAIARDCR